MDRLRLRFWNALEHFCILMLVFSGVLALLELTGRTPVPLNKFVNPSSSLEHMRFLPPDLTETWAPLALLSFFFAAGAGAASRRKKLWHPSGFKTLPAPNGGYLRKANPAHLRKEFSGAPWKTRRSAKAHFRKAERYFVKNQYGSAATEYRKSASVFATMSAHLNEGVSLCYTSRFRKAADAFDEGLSMALGEENLSFASAFHCNICIPYRELGRLEETYVSFKEAYSICMRSGDSLGRLCAVGNSGALHLARGEPDEALQSWRYALDGLAETRCGIALAVALDGAGCAYTAKEEFPQALNRHRKALAIYRRHRILPGTTGALVNIGQAHARLGRRWRSLRVNRKALKFAARYGSVVDQARIHAGTGLAHAKRGRLDDALKSAEKALELYEQIDNPLEAARQLADIAVICASQKQTKEALRKLGEARANFQKVGASFGEYRALEKRMEMALRGNPDNGSKRKPVGAKRKTLPLADQA
jgi:tetratricopeptide (TPR) repeat protein